LRWEITKQFYEKKTGGGGVDATSQDALALAYGEADERGRKTEAAASFKLRQNERYVIAPTNQKNGQRRRNAILSNKTMNAPPPYHPAWEQLITVAAD